MNKAQLLVFLAIAAMALLLGYAVVNHAHADEGLGVLPEPPAFQSEALWEWIGANYTCEPNDIRVNGEPMADAERMKAACAERDRLVPTLLAEGLCFREGDWTDECK